MAEFGPALPPSLVQNGPDAPKDDGEGPSHRVGPTVSMENSLGSKGLNTFGPVLPPSLKPSPPTDDRESRAEMIGPALPGHLVGSTEEEDVLIGPLPPAAGSQEVDELERKKREIEARSVSMHDKLTKTDEDIAPRREEWMTKLPSDVKAFGLGPRKFCTNYIDPGDRSVWTDTPADRLRKEQQASQEDSKEKKAKKHKEEPVISQRDQELAKKVEEYNRTTRSESLVQIHRKRKAAAGPQDKERRPFNRETDLELPHRLITPSKRQALVKASSKSLDNKFTHGTRHFL